MLMSRKRVFGSEEHVALPAFGKVISAVEPHIMVSQSVQARKLGRTAEALELIKQEAREEGYQDGFESGRIDGIRISEQQLTDQMSQLLLHFATALDQKITQLDSAMQEWYARSEQSLAELAVTIARQIVQQELQLPHDTISNIVRQALSEVTHSAAVRVIVNPYDVEAIADKKAELMAAVSTVRNLEIVEDPSLLGGCIIESDGGRIDATVNTKFDLVEGTIREAA